MNDKYTSYRPNVWGNEHTDDVSTVLENMKRDTSYYNKTIFEIRLAIYNLIYQDVINIRHILSNYINNQCILSQIVNDNLLNILNISVVSFIPKLNLIISVMNIVYWMIAKLVMFGVWKFLSIYKQISFECIHSKICTLRRTLYLTIKCYVHKVPTILYPEFSFLLRSTLSLSTLILQDFCKI